MRTVQELLASKPAGVVTISPDAAVFGALERMAAHDVGALVVVDAGRTTSPRARFPLPRS